MSEQAVTKLEVVPAAKFDSAIGEQAVGRVSFVDESGAPVDVGGGGGGLDPAVEARIAALEGKVTTLEGKVSTLEGKVAALEGAGA